MTASDTLMKLSETIKEQSQQVTVVSVALFRDETSTLIQREGHAVEWCQSRVQKHKFLVQ